MSAVEDVYVHLWERGLVSEGEVHAVQAHLRLWLELGLPVAPWATCCGRGGRRCGGEGKGDSDPEAASPTHERVHEQWPASGSLVERWGGSRAAALARNVLLAVHVNHLHSEVCVDVCRVRADIDTCTHTTCIHR